MDYGFTLIPVTMLFLNHSGSVTIRFTLLDNRAVAIPITIMAFANAHASADGTNSNSNIVRQSWRRNGSYGMRRFFPALIIADRGFQCIGTSAVPCYDSEAAGTNLE
jgi:hypothetical protein